MQLDEIKKLHQQGLLQEAKQGYLSILKTNPTDVEALHLLAIVSAEEENFVKAREYLETAISLAPEDVALRLNLANILKAQGLYDDAEVILQELLLLTPRSAAAQNNLGTLYYARGQWQEAIQAYQLAIDIQPDYADAYYNLGLALTKARKWVEALHVYEALLALSSEHAGARFQLGCLLMQQGQFKAAAENFAALERMHPHHFETQTNLATCYLKLALPEQAIPHYLKALALMPDDIQSLFNLGVIHMQQGKMDAAIDYFLQCLKINPDYYEAHHNLGAVYLAIKNQDASIRHFREAVRLHPHDEAIRHTLRILSGDQPLLASPPAYIETLFNSYADHYDAHVINALHYQVPEIMLDMLMAAGLKPEANLDILDLGCGTGLCGELLFPFAKSLTGVDLSPNMLGLAVLKKCYTQLVKADFTLFLKTATDRYDLVVAGDSIVYLPDLQDVFNQISRLLKEGGWFIFNIEKSDAESDYIPVSGRFAHRPSYIENLAAGAHLKIVSRQAVVLRTQDERPVQGLIYLMKN